MRSTGTQQSNSPGCILLRNFLEKMTSYQGNVLLYFKTIWGRVLMLILLKTYTLYLFNISIEEYSLFHRILAKTMIPYRGVPCERDT